MRLRLLLVLLSLALGVGGASSVPSAAETLSGAWTQAGPEEFDLGQREGLTLEGEGALLLEGSALVGTYTSPLHQASLPFGAVGVGWQASLPEGTNLQLQVRASYEGRHWSEWQGITQLDVSSEGSREICTNPGSGDGAQVGLLGGALVPQGELTFLSGRYLQYQATLSRRDATLSPRLRAVTLTYINAAQGPTAQELARAARQRAGLGGRPSIISRAQWGANESYRFREGEEVWPPQYSFRVKAIIHHTATRNDEPDPAATVRAIYYYHAVTLGWGDIGYNYLVDRLGNIYEGRFGGDNVMGAHALRYNPGSVGIGTIGTYSQLQPTSELGQALVNLLIWELSTHGVHPLGSGFFVDREFPHILGHRDALDTSCPGDQLYSLLPQLRARVWEGFPSYAVGWASHTTPKAMFAGKGAEVTLMIRNGGKRTWTAVQRPFYRLGYRWYDSQGKRVIQPPEEDHRTPLTRDVEPGEAITLKAQVTAPKALGVYTLKWDMVQEGVTWFADTGSPTLDLTVAVGEALYGAGWLSHATPNTMRVGEGARVEIRLQNSGITTWTAEGKNPYHLGYHWFDADGKQYVQPHEEDIRTALPGDVGPGDEVKVVAGVTAPRRPGRYTLAWDMVHEGIAWFADRGNQPLKVTVEVSARTDQGYLPFVPRGVREGW